MPPRNVLVCVDESPQSTKALQWSLANVLHTKQTGTSQDELHIVTVLANTALNVIYPIAPVAAGAAVAAMHHNYEASRRAEEMHAAGTQ